MEIDFVNARLESPPTGGVASGGGSEARGGLSPLPFAVAAALFAALALSSWVFPGRRRSVR